MVLEPFWDSKCLYLATHIVALANMQSWRGGCSKSRWKGFSVTNVKFKGISLCAFYVTPLSSNIKWNFQVQKQASKNRREELLQNLLKTSLMRGCGRLVFWDLLSFLGFGETPSFDSAVGGSITEGASGSLRISLVRRYHPPARSSVLHQTNQ